EIVALGDSAPSHLAVGQHVIGEHCTGCPPASPAREWITVPLRAWEPDRMGKYRVLMYLILQGNGGRKGNC
ncbi:unnamed protein product, partial [Symbiodinium microadriaticum]